MEKLRAVTFLILTGIYYLLHFMQAENIGNEMIRFYGKDLITVPLLVLAVSFTSRLINLQFGLRTMDVVFTVVYVSVVFEWILPKTGMAFEGDWRDIICYTTGGAITILTLNCGLESEKKLCESPSE